MVSIGMSPPCPPTFNLRDSERQFNDNLGSQFPCTLLVHSLLYIWEQPSNSEVISNLSYWMGSLLHRRVRTYILQGHSVPKYLPWAQPVHCKTVWLLALHPQSREGSVGPVLWAWLAMQVMGVCLAITCWGMQDPPAHTLPPCTHTQGHAAVPL